MDGPDDFGLLRTVWIPFVMTDAALLHSVVLVAATHYSTVHGPNSHNIDIIALRGMAIAAIGASTRDSARHTSNETIAAIANIASFEALYGDSEAYATHMIGLRHLVRSRGGLGSLGLDGFLERLLVWIDANASYITNQPHFFDNNHCPPSLPHPRPDPASFGVRRDSAYSSYSTTYEQNT